ncbi:ABC transporter permease [Afifella pfennigii]|uniref:ABC transporter permease n=1 Tax=Afifella pfennigii TaxID=209897 RepID=UPI00047B50FE|nr:ABC transporter permease [Afifella pfennigii]
MTSAGGVLPGETPPRRRLRLGWFAFLAPLLFLLVVFFVIPLIDLLSVSFAPFTGGPRGEAGEFTLANYAKILGDPFYLQMMWNSVQLGVYSTVFALLIGYAVAFYLSRTSGWERTLISVACILPIFVNVIVGILGWYILLLPFGVFQQALTALGLIDGPLRWLRSFWALVAVLTWEHLPFAILILVSSLQHVPADKIAAARIAGASNFQILRTVLLPLTMPGIVASAILVFSLSVSSYLVPILIAGPRAQVIPLSIFSFASELLNWPMASALAFLLLIVVAVITYAFIALTNRLTRRGEWEMV